MDVLRELFDGGTLGSLIAYCSFLANTAASVTDCKLGPWSAATTIELARNRTECPLLNAICDGFRTAIYALNLGDVLNLGAPLSRAFHEGGVLYHACR